MATPFELTRPRTLWRWFRQWRLSQLVQATDRIAVLEHVDEGGRLGPRYAFMTVMSAGIAMLGLLQGSAAVIIGAMLISPLMGPIIELGLGLATFDLRSVRGALKTLGVGVALALAIAVSIVWFSPLKEPTTELLARTQPTFFDLLIAVFSGLAGAYATVTRKGETIVGVAIATALMPPLAVVGFGLAVANWDIAGGAAFLFMTNLLAIALSATMVARWYGFGGSDSPRQTALQAGLIVAAFVLLSIPLVLALKRIGMQSQTELSVRAAVDDVAARTAGRVSALRVDATTDAVGVDVVMMVPRHVNGLQARLQRELSARVARPVNVQLREILTADDASFARQQGTLAQLRNSVASLESAQSTRLEAARATELARTRTQARLLSYFGQLRRSSDGLRWELRLAPETALPLSRALQIERELNAPVGDVAATALEVYPALRQLPAMVLGTQADGATAPGTAAVPDAAVDAPPAFTPSEQAAISAQAWALQRWRAGAVDIALSASTPALDDARIAAVQAALQSRGLRIGSVRREKATDIATLRLSPAAAVN